MKKPAFFGQTMENSSSRRLEQTRLIIRKGLQRIGYNTDDKCNTGDNEQKVTNITLRVLQKFQEDFNAGCFVELENHDEWKPMRLESS